jgi:hypothetical protein
VFFKIDAGEWVDYDTISRQSPNLSSGVYNIEWMIEDKGYTNFGGTITHTVGPVNGQDGGVEQEPSGFEPTKMMWVIIAVILLFVIGGSVITGVLLVPRARPQIKINNTETQVESATPEVSTELSQK